MTTKKEPSSSRPEVREKIRQSLKAYYASEDRRKSQSQRVKDYHARAKAALAALEAEEADRG